MGSAAFRTLLLTEKYKGFSKFRREDISDALFLKYLFLNNLLAKIG
jgi:hypothetical protein